MQHYGKEGCNVHKIQGLVCFLNLWSWFGMFSLWQGNNRKLQNRILVLILKNVQIKQWLIGYAYCTS